jgi:hypothetical protein
MLNQYLLQLFNYLSEVIVYFIHLQMNEYTKNNKKRMLKFGIRNTKMTLNMGVHGL